MQLPETPAFVTRFTALFQKNQTTEDQFMAQLAQELNELPPGAHKAMLSGQVGPISFIASRYGICLVIMAIVLNRIYHMVRIPPRRPNQPAAPPTRGGRIFPLPPPLIRLLSSPHITVVLRLPGLFFLGRAWLLLTIITIQAGGFWPSSRVTDRVGQWAEGMEMAKVCWNIFLAVCGSMVLGNTARGLEQRMRDDISSFNLFGLSYLLHLYSSPMTHTRSSLTHGRPDIHALIELWLCLSELFWLQLHELSNKWRLRRLIPTTTLQVLGMVHFSWTLWTAPNSFPPFAFVSYMMGMLSVAVICITILLNLLTQIFQLHGIQPSTLLPISITPPHLSEDFASLLLRSATACMTSSRLAAGLNNELAVVSMEQLLKPPGLELGKFGVENQMEDWGLDRDSGKGKNGGGFGREVKAVHGKTGKKGTSLHSIFGNSLNRYGGEMKRFWNAAFSIITTVLRICWSATPGSKFVERMGRGAWNARWWYGPRGIRFWRRDTWRGVPPALRGPGHIDPVRARMLAAAIRARGPPRGRADAGRRVNEPEVIEISSDEGEESDWEHRSFREMSEATTAGGSETDGEGTVMSDGDEDGENPGVLFADLMMSPSTPRRRRNRGRVSRSTTPQASSSAMAIRQPSPFDDSLQPLLLAHLLNPGSTPLTRRAYSRLINREGEGSSEAGVIERYRDVMGGRQAMVEAKNKGDADEAEEERKRCCVVCIVEPRDTILWPCRCLALCSDCRENLAERLPAAQHMCPCCRTKVDGFSRIFLP